VFIGRVRLGWLCSNTKPLISIISRLPKLSSISLRGFAFTIALLTLRCFGSGRNIQYHHLESAPVLSHQLWYSNPIWRKWSSRTLNASYVDEDTDDLEPRQPRSRPFSHNSPLPWFAARLKMLTDNIWKSATWADLIRILLAKSLPSWSLVMLKVSGQYNLSTRGPYYGYGRRFVVFKVMFTRVQYDPAKKLWGHTPNDPLSSRFQLDGRKCCFQNQNGMGESGWPKKRP
jgi:hypothetical protein